MKKLIYPIAFIILLSSCIVELDMNPAHIEVQSTDEYEEKNVTNEVWRGNVLVQQTYTMHTFLEIKYHNSGGLRARNVYTKVHFYDNGYHIKTIIVDLPSISPHETIVQNLDTDFDSIYDYSDYEVEIFWD